MKTIHLLCTDFGDVPLPEPAPKFPTKSFKSTRYDEYTGKPYKITETYLDYESPLGKHWLAYERYVSAMAEAVWRTGGGAPEIEAIKVMPFSKWMGK